MNAGRRPAERSCLGCRRVRPQNELVRYVLGPDGRLVVDPGHRLPGRGAYTCPDRDCIARAVRGRQFARALRRPVPEVSAEELVATLGSLLAERIRGLVAMARKAGQVVSGSSQVLRALGDAEGLGLVLAARDASGGTAERVAGKAAAVGTDYRRCFDKEVFGRLLGKEERSVVAVRNHPLAERLKQELVRYTHIAGEN